MCIIVDANAAHDLSVPSEHGKPVLRWLMSKGRLIVGGTITRELIRAGLENTLVVLDRAGRLKKMEEDEVEVACQKFKKSRFVRSNDPHLLALAEVSGCKLIFTRDQMLHEDLKNQKLIHPTPSIYQSDSHQHLLTECHD